MSIINRMLADLERRGAPSRRDSASDLRPTPRPRRRLRPGPRLLLAGIAVVVTVVAASLWIQRGDRILAALPPLPWSSEPAPRLVQMAFEQGGGQARLRFELSDEPPRTPRYSRSGGSATLVVDAERGDLLLTAPPSGQRVFRGVSLEPVEADGTRIRLELDPAAELDLVARGRRITLVGAMPAPAAPETGVAAEEVAAAEAATAATAPEAPVVTAESAGPGEPERPEAADPSRAAADAAGGAEPPAPAAGTATAADAQAAQAAAAGAPDEAEVTVAESEPADADAGAGAGAASAVDAADDAPAPVAERAADAGQTVGAVRKTQSMSPEVRARRRYREAREALDRGELATARRALQEALDLDPSLHAARDLLVGLVRRAGDTVAARRLLAEGVDLAPARIQFAMPYARLLVDTGALDRAAEVLEEARVAGSGSADFHALLAAIEQRRGQHRAAAAEYTRALEIRPGNGLWWLGLGISLAAIEQPREAKSAFREARASGTLEPSLDRWAQDRIDGLNRKTEG